MFKNKKNWLKVIKVVFIILLIVALFKLLVPLFNTHEFKQLIVRLGMWGPLIFILYSILAHVLAPLVGSPMFLVSIAIYGIFRTALFYYIASLISCTINFYISRKFGRPWVEKLGGRKTLKQVDKIVDKLGIKILIFSRIFGYSIFDVISYAAGFTNMSFKRYFTITAVFSLVPLLGFVYFFKDMTMSLEMILLYIGIILAIVIFFVLVMKRILKSGNDKI